MRSGTAVFFEYLSRRKTQLKMKTQVHGKFKFFLLDFKNGKLSKADQKAVTDFANGAGVLVKSIGIEYIESEKRVLLSLGYEGRRNAERVGIAISKIGKLDAKKLEKSETKMAQLAAKAGQVICHELFIDDKKQLFAIFLKRA